MASRALSILLVNCDRLVKLEDIKRELFPFKETIVDVSMEYFPLKEMTAVANSIKTRQHKPDMALFVVHAGESRLSINEPSAGIGYAKIYTALQEATGEKVIVVIANDKNYVDNTEAISRWARHKIASQFTKEYLTGPKGHVFSWHTKPEICHKKVLLNYIQENFEGEEVSRHMLLEIEREKKYMQQREMKTVDTQIDMGLPQVEKAKPIYKYEDDIKVPPNRYTEETFGFIKHWKSEFEERLHTISSIHAFLSDGSVDGKFIHLLRQNGIHDDQGDSPPSWLKISPPYKKCQEDLSKILFITTYKLPNGNLTWVPTDKDTVAGERSGHGTDTQKTDTPERKELEQKTPPASADILTQSNASGQLQVVAHSSERDDRMSKYRCHPDVLKCLKRCVETLKKFDLDVVAILAFMENGQPDDKFATMLVNHKIVEQCFNEAIKQHLTKSKSSPNFVAFIIRNDTEYKVIEYDIMHIDRFLEDLEDQAKVWFVWFSRKLPKGTQVKTVKIQNL